ncbi:MAG: hypothetical protein OEZ22_00575 [Spirochaetia bacterium]|nr:hypothetical protein [Spirochaetia bacterium]
MKHIFFFVFFIDFIFMQNFYLTAVEPPEFLSIINSEESLKYKSYGPKIFEENEWFIVKDENIRAYQNNKAVDLLNKNKFIEAEVILKDLLKKTPHFIASRLNLGRLYLFQKDYEKALFYFISAKNLFPKYGKIYYYLGKTYEKLQNINLALINYKLSYRYNIYDLQALACIGNLYIKQNNFTEAENIFKIILKQDGTYNNGFIGMGILNLKQKNYYKSLLYFYEVKTHILYNKIFHFYFAEALTKQKNYEKALEEYKIILKYKNELADYNLSENFILKKIKHYKNKLK